MECGDRVQRVDLSINVPIEAEGTVVEVKRNSGGREFVRVCWDNDKLGYHPWYSPRQLINLTLNPAPELDDAHAREN